MIRLTLALLAFMATRLNVRTLAGRDHQAKVMGDNASTGTGDYASACWIGLTENTDAPDENHTSLAGEISSGTLARAQGTFLHTSGTNIYTITKSFTSDQAVEIAKIGVFNAATGGVMAFESTIDPVPLRSGDQVQITEAITLG